MKREISRVEPMRRFFLRPSWLVLGKILNHGEQQHSPRYGDIAAGKPGDRERFDFTRVGLELFAQRRPGVKR